MVRQGEARRRGSALRMSSLWLRQRAAAASAPTRRDASTGCGWFMPIGGWRRRRRAPKTALVQILLYVNRRRPGQARERVCVCVCVSWCVFAVVFVCSSSFLLLLCILFHLLCLCVPPLALHATDKQIHSLFVCVCVSGTVCVCVCMRCLLCRVSSLSRWWRCRRSIL